MRFLCYSKKHDLICPDLYRIILTKTGNWGNSNFETFTHCSWLNFPLFLSILAPHFQTGKAKLQCKWSEEKINSGRYFMYCYGINYGDNNGNLIYILSSMFYVNFFIFTGKHLCWTFKTPKQVLSCEYCEVLILGTPASNYSNLPMFFEKNCYTE